MTYTLTGWILIAAILVSGMTAGSTAGGMLDDALSEGAIQRRDFMTVLLFGALTATAALLLLGVETQ